MLAVPVRGPKGMQEIEISTLVIHTSDLGGVRQQAMLLINCKK